MRLDGNGPRLHPCWVTTASAHLRHGSRPPALLRGGRWYARSIASEYRPYLAFARRRYESSTIDAGTELVIEGFPRSASTFASVSFQLAQSRPVRLAHHLHAPAQITEAVRTGTPALVTIRQPRDAVISCVIREPYIPLGWAIDAYARFYQALGRHRDAVVFAPFDQVTTDLPSLISQVNERFGTAFDPGLQNDAAVERCFQLIDLRARGGAPARWINRYVSGLIDSARLAEALAAIDDASVPEIPEHRVARPSTARAADRESLRLQYELPKFAKLRSKAERAYFVALGGSASD